MNDVIKYIMGLLLCPQLPFILSASMDPLDPEVSPSKVPFGRGHGFVSNHRKVYLRLKKKLGLHSLSMFL